LADSETKQLRASQYAVMVDQLLVFSSVMASIVRDTVMNTQGIPVEIRKKIITTVEGEVDSLLKGKGYQH
jgi:hypothetical protein